jgi:CelD/BcsL family acetyltransferase involved in cellulose biosynthesis
MGGFDHRRSRAVAEPRRGRPARYLNPEKAMMAMLASRIVVLAEPGGEALAREWDELVDRLGCTPFMRPGWIDAWWRAFGSGRLQILCARRSGGLVGVLPLGRRGSAQRSPTNFHTPEFAVVGEDGEAMRALADSAFAQRPRRLTVAFVDPASAATAQLRAAGRAAGYRVFQRALLSSPYVHLGTDWPTYEQSLSRNLRGDLRRCRRRLREEGEVTVAFHQGDGLDAAVDEVFAVEARSWKASQGTAIVSRDNVKRFYEQVCRWAAARGSLRIAILRLDGRPLAMDVGILEGAVHYAVKGSYDAEYARYSPGKLLLHALLEQAFEEGVERVELLGAEDPYKRAWAAHSRERDVVEAFAPSLAGSLEWIAEARGRPLARRLGLRRYLELLHRRR